MNAWNDLPNAKHIDWMLASLKKNPKVWSVAWDAARGAAWGAVQGAAQGAARDAARDAAYDAAGNAAWNAARSAARAAARAAAWNAAYDAAGNAAWNAARSAARSAIAALVAYDHCEKYLSMTPDELYVWWKLSEDPACLLLMPMVKVLTGWQDTVIMST